MAKDELKKTHETWKEKKYVYLSYMLSPILPKT
jgi:hypothetical protein